MMRLKLVGAAALLAALGSAGCDGKASPEAEVTCLNTPDIEITTGSTSAGGIVFVIVSKSVAMVDEGLGGAVPANGIVATVISPLESIQSCEGDCLDGDGNFDQQQDVTTDEFGLLVYTLGIDVSQPFMGDIIESFNPFSSCSTPVTVGP